MAKLIIYFKNATTTIIKPTEVMITI